MSKKAVFVVGLAFAGIFWFSAAFGQGAASTTQDINSLLGKTEIKVQDLGTENPGMLPTNPFYFLKEWRRSFKRLFVSNQPSGAESELQSTNERAAEIKKLSDLNSIKTESIQKAISSYKTNIEELQKKISALPTKSQNPNIAELLNKIIDQYAKHRELFDNLISKFEGNNEIKLQINLLTREKLDSMAAETLVKFDDKKSFNQALVRITASKLKGVYADIAALQILNELSNKITDENLLNEIDNYSDKLVEKIGAGIKKMTEAEKEKAFNSDVLEKLQGDNLWLSLTLNSLKDYLGDETVSRKIDEFDLKTAEKQFKEGTLTSNNITGLINDANFMIKNFWLDKPTSTPQYVRDKISRFMENASTTLGESQKALESGNLVLAYEKGLSARKEMYIAVSYYSREKERGFKEDKKEVFYFKEECEEIIGKQCVFEQCGVIPAGKTPEEVCGKDFKKGWVATDKDLKEEENQACIMLYAPVCGSDNKTYSNSCFAKAAGIKDYREGECSLNKSTTNN